MFIYWQQPLRITGPASPGRVSARLQSMVSSGHFSLRDRLSGSLKGARLRVWKQNLAGHAGDIVEFDGILRAGDDGTIIEGALRYRLQTKIQFGGLLVISFGLLGTGLMHLIHGADNRLLILGGAITMLTLAWIHASRRTRHLQIRFIEERLTEACVE